LAAALGRIPVIMGALIVLLGTTVLAGWQAGFEPAKRILPHFVAMNPLTAVAFMLAGCALIMSNDCLGAKPWKTGVRILLAIAVAAIGAARLLGCLGGPDFHLDQVLYAGRLTEGGLAGQVAVPNRVSPNTALLFVIGGLALALLGAARPGARKTAIMLSVGGAFLSLVATVGYFNGVSTLYRPTVLIPMALHTAIGAFLLCAGIFAVAARPAPAVTSADGATRMGQPLPLPVEKKIGYGFGAALFLLALIGVVCHVSLQDYAVASQANVHSRRVTGEITELIAALADAETGVRGYVIAGEERFLEPRDSAVSTTYSALEALKNWTREDSREQQRWKQVSTLVDQHFAWLDAVISVRAVGDIESAHRLVATGNGQVIMDQLRKLLTEAKEWEERLQDLRAVQTTSSNRVTSTVITVGGLMAFAVVGAAGLFIRRDLANKQRLYEEIRDARRAADEASSAKSRFLANMSHEIRTPMAAIIGYTDLLLDPSQGASDRLDYINTIRRNGEHLLTVINDILDLSKIEAGKLQIDSAECCPCQVLSDVASLMRVRAVEKSVRLEVRNDGLVPSRIRTDAARLRQVLINLVGNAIKFTDEGWVRLIMRLHEQPGRPAVLRFDIVDTGIGMSPAEVAQLFQPFVQVDGSLTRRFGGTGLGLTISKRLISMLGGWIEVDSSPGRGSTFSVFIDPGPLDGVLMLESCREALVGVAPNQPRTSGITQLQGRVLLVDDGEDNRRLLSVYLRQAGVEVTMAENGRTGSDAALAAAASDQPYDVVLMDMQMPELDGYGAAARLRSKGYSGPIIALTAHAMAEDRTKCLNAGCTDYLSKPVRREDLLAMVSKYVRPAVDVRDKRLPVELHTKENLAGGQQDTLRSTLDDHELHPFLQAFVGELPGRIKELQACLAAQDLDQLSLKIHNLKGTGGLYGLMPISDAAAEVEALISSNAPLEAISDKVLDLINIVRRTEGFQATLLEGTTSPTPPG
jgi:signal transduction histidine kinase/FixJ family two-component response regulator/HPt (histidine-containing phosphotransfer) domain-containing protein